MSGDARERLIAELREHALVIGEVTLTSGAVVTTYSFSAASRGWSARPSALV